ncbi:MAG: response regulator transcription factor [Bacteroidetes bacterium]|nr:response regulator transcription factor [Bacteroidota bacterium]
MQKARKKIIIADSNYLTRAGLVSLVSEMKGFEVVSEVENKAYLLEKIKLYDPEVVVIDYSTSGFKLDTIHLLNKKHPVIQILAITPEISAGIISKALDSGVISHLLKHCDKEEIIEALYKTIEGQRFLCGKIVDRLMANELSQEKVVPSMAACDGMNVTDREMEIIKLIAEGYSNKKIAEMLFLSSHTVTTHRKNIMSKLGVNNTAGVVLFAVRENLLTPNKYLFS